MRSEIKIEVQSNCVYCIIKCKRHSVALYYLVKKRDEIGRRIKIGKEQRKKEGKKRLGRRRRLQNL